MEAMNFDGFLSESTIDGEGRKTETIRNVLLCGLQSLNGRSFNASSFGGQERVKALYDGVHVYLNHDIEAGPSRKTEELAGIVTNVRTDSLGRPRGDILVSDNKAGEELRSLVRFSKRASEVGAKLKDVGMSHVARYTFASHDSSTVQSVDEVFSVDVVIRPATTKSFHESHVPESLTAADFLGLLGNKGPIIDQIDYAFNERALFDPSYRDDDGFDAAEVLSTLSDDTPERSTALESVPFI